MKKYFYYPIIVFTNEQINKNKQFQSLLFPVSFVV